MSDKSKSSYHHGDLRNALIEAAISLVREKGPNAFSLREVAKQAGVSHAAPYRHFNDKLELLSAIAHSGFRLFAQRLSLVEQKFATDPKQQLIEAGIAYVELAVKNPEITQLMFGGFIAPDKCSEELLVDADNAFNHLLRIIENGKQAGLYQNRETMDLALAAWSMVHGLAMLITGGQLADWTTNQEQVRNISRLVSELLLEGLLAK